MGWLGPTRSPVLCHCLLLAVSLDVSRPRREEASGWTFAARTTMLLMLLINDTYLITETCYGTEVTLYYASYESMSTLIMYIVPLL